MPKPPLSSAPRSAAETLASARADFDALLAKLHAERDAFFLTGMHEVDREPHWGDVGSAYRLNSLLAGALAWAKGAEE
jgi:hypothetical protein